MRFIEAPKRRRPLAYVVFDARRHTEAAAATPEPVVAVCVYCHCEAWASRATLAAEGWIVASDRTAPGQSALAICPACAVLDARS